MPTLSAIRRLIAALSILTGALLVPVSLAAQGVSPFGDATPAVEDATPVASTSAAWEIADTRELSIDGMPVTLSPDGQWIAGVGPDREICVWAVETLEPTCAERGDYRPNVDAMAWAPDSTAVAFTEDSARMMVDSDLHVFEVNGGVLTNLTDDGFSGSLPFSSDELLPNLTLDLGPAWSADSQSIVVGRTFWTSEEDARNPEIVSISRTGGSEQVLAILETDSVWGVIYPIVPLDDGTLVYAVLTDVPDNPNEGIWILEPGGKPVQLVPGAADDTFPMSLVLDAARTDEGLVISGYSGPLASRGRGFEPYAFTYKVDTGDLVTLAAGVTPVRFGPDGATTIAVDISGDDAMLAITAPGGEVSLLGPVPRSRYDMTRGFDWAANDTVLIVSQTSGATLVTLAGTAP